MRILLKFFALVAVSAVCARADQSYSNWCQQGGNQVTTAGIPSTSLVQASFPGCRVTVFITGSGGTKATIYSDNGITPLSNPFTAAGGTGFFTFYAANGTYDVQEDVTVPVYTIPAVSLFDVSGYTPMACGSTGQVQYNNAGAFGCDANLTWNPGSGVLAINTLGDTTDGLIINETSTDMGAQAGVYLGNAGYGGINWSLTSHGVYGLEIQDIGASGFPVIFNALRGGATTFTPENGTVVVNGVLGLPSIYSNGGFIQSQGGFLSGANNWQGIQSSTDGALLSGYGLVQNRFTNLNGGYIDIAPITYNPHDGGPCMDANGNPVQQPVPLNGLANFGATDTILWVGTSPQMPPGGACGAILPINADQGLFLNSYLFARAGLATDSGAYNAINTIYLSGGAPSGGVEADSYTAGTLYPAGTVTTTGPLATATYLGGYMSMGHSVGPPAAGTIATVTNPLTGGDGINQGTFYFDDAFNVPFYWNGSAWINWGGSGGGGCSVSGVRYSVQINNPLGNCYGDANFTYLPTGSPPQVSLAGNFLTTTTTGGFDASLCTAFNCIQAPSGGVHGLAFTASKYVQTGNSAGVPALTVGDTFHAGALYCDTTSSPCAEQLYNGSAWVALATGGSTSPGGSTNYIQFNSAGAFAGDVKFQWCATIAGACTGTGYILVTPPPSPVQAGLAVAGGFVQADQGFLGTAANCTLWNCFYGAGGGMAAKSFTATAYIQTGSAAGAPTPTSGDTLHAGAISWDTNDDCSGAPFLRVYNGTSHVCLNSGGGSSFWTASGANIYNNNTGFVGIGTTTPAQELEVNGNTQTDGDIYLKKGTTPFIGSVDNFPVRFGQNTTEVFRTDGAYLLVGATAPDATGYLLQSPSGVSATNGFTTTGGAFNSAVTGTATAFIANSGAFVVNGAGAVSANGIFSSNGSSGGFNVTADLAANSIQTVGGVDACNSNSATGGNAIEVNNITVVNCARQATFALATSAEFSATNTGTALTFQNNNGNFQVNGNGAVSIATVLTAGSSIAPNGGVNVFNPALNSIQTSGSINACNTGAATSSAAYQANGVNVISCNGTASFPGGSVLGGATIITGILGVTGTQAFFNPGITLAGAAPTVSPSQIGLGSTTAASTSCGTLALAAGCMVINVNGTTRYVPYY
jgi:hypothetical protein